MVEVYEMWQHYIFSTVQIRDPGLLLHLWKICWRGSLDTTPHGIAEEGFTWQVDQIKYSSQHVCVRKSSPAPDCSWPGCMGDTKMKHNLWYIEEITEDLSNRVTELLVEKVQMLDRIQVTRRNSQTTPLGFASCVLFCFLLSLSLGLAQAHFSGWPRKGQAPATALLAQKKKKVGWVAFSMLMRWLAGCSP